MFLLLSRYRQAVTVAPFAGDGALSGAACASAAARFGLPILFWASGMLSRCILPLYGPDGQAACKGFGEKRGRKPKKRRPGLPPEAALVVGDRLYTDIACGVNAGVDSAFVLSGEGTLADLESSGVHGNYLEEQECLQGNAVIQVTPQGENCILLFGGSNRAVTPGQVERTVAQFGAGDWLVAQNEVSCLQEMICAAAGRGMRIALNPSPFDDALQDLPYGVMDWIFINEVEGKQMTGRAEPEAILETLRRRYPRLSVALTLGGEGALLATPERTIRQAAFPVKAVDTTAAGDTFTGFFLAALTGGLPLEECARRAAAASALAVTRPGASESIPMAAEVDAMLREAFAP